MSNCVLDTRALNVNGRRDDENVAASSFTCVPFRRAAGWRAKLTRDPRCLSSA